MKEASYTVLYGFDPDTSRWEANLIDEKDNVVDYIYAFDEEEIKNGIDMLKIGHNIKTVKKVNLDDPIHQMTDDDLYFDHTNDKTMKEKAEEINSHELTEEELYGSVPKSYAESDEYSTPEDYGEISTAEFIVNAFLVIGIVIDIIGAVYCISNSLGGVLAAFIVHIVINGAGFPVAKALFNGLRDIKAVRHYIENKKK